MRTSLLRARAYAMFSWARSGSTVWFSVELSDAEDGRFTSESLGDLCYPVIVGRLL